MHHKKCCHSDILSQARWKISLKLFNFMRFLFQDCGLPLELIRLAVNSVFLATERIRMLGLLHEAILQITGTPTYIAGD